MASTAKVAASRNLSFGDVAPEIVQLAINYASDYLDYMDNLPFDLQRHVTRLREVDKKCREHVKEIEQLYDSFMKESASGTKARRSYLLQIRRLFGFCKELGDEKIAIVQSISEVIESRNKQMEYESKRFNYAYEPDTKLESDLKREKEKLDPRGSKRSRRPRNIMSSDHKEKLSCQKEQDKPSKSGLYEDADEPPTKVVASSPNSDQSSVPVAVPALTRGALREEDKRVSSRSKDKEETKQEKATEQGSNSTNSGKSLNESTSVTNNLLTSTSSSIGKSKSSVSSSSSAIKSNGKKKKKRKLTKHHSERHQSNNNDDISPLLDLPIDPDEPTYCLCQQVSFGQMIGCDNPKCPIEWFHFSCVRLTHKPKGKWYCPDCQLKRKRDCKRNDNR